MTTNIFTCVCPENARDVDQLKVCVEQIGADPAYVAIHQTSLADESVPVSIDIFRKFLGIFYRMMHAKPGEGLHGILIIPGQNEPLTRFFCPGDIVDFEIEEPIDFIHLHEMITRLEGYLFNPDPEAIPPGMWPKWITDKE